MIKYSLMHKNDKCGTILFDENIGRITEYHDDRNGLSPYLGNCDIKKIQKWMGDESCSCVKSNDAAGDK